MLRGAGFPAAGLTAFAAAILAAANPAASGDETAMAGYQRTHEQATQGLRTWCVKRLPRARHHWVPARS